MNKDNYWIKTFYDHSSMFEDCYLLVKGRQWQTWPDCNELNSLWPYENSTHSGLVTRFVDQDEIAFNGKYYEEYIHEHGNIPTRGQNWHDFFNALVWCQFPKTKSLINALHVEEMQQQKATPGNKRTRKRDALTLFDESGVIFVTSKGVYEQTLLKHQWIDLFYDNRSDWWKKISVFIFGHGLYEKALNPYIGMTGNALMYIVTDEFFSLERQVQILELDKSLVNVISRYDRLAQPDCLTPLPLLGVPGWWHENHKKDFYDNTDYFRPGKNLS